MYLKFAITAGAIILLAVLGYAFLGPSHFVKVAGTHGIVLVPEALGKAKAIKRWRNDLAGSVLEVGALYEAGVYGPAPIILDFRRGDPKAHNGIGCFLISGGTLVFERLKSLRTANGVVLFDVGVVRTGNKLRMLAAAACTPRECRGQPLNFGKSLAERLSWKTLLGQGYSNGVVPMAIILEYAIGPEGQDATIAKLAAQLQRVMLHVDLESARRLAAVQSGNEDALEILESASRKSPVGGE